MSTTINKNQQEFWLKKAQFESRQSAGTLVIGAIYHITDDKYANIITGATAPTTSTEGEVGDLYINTTTNKVYICAAISDSTYTWEQFANTSDIPTSIDGLAGGQLTSALILSGGDAVSGVANIQLDTNGQITAKGTTATLLGRNSSNLLVGHNNYILKLRGSATRPTYKDNDLALYSDLPSVYDGTLTIQKNGTDIVTFTANDNGTKTANITVPTTVAELSDSGNYELAANKTTTLSSSSTNTQYPGAKIVYDTIEDVREVAEGKTKSYITRIAMMSSLNTQDEYVDVNSFKDYNGNTIALTDFSVGDNVFITDTNVPDRWVSYVDSASMRLHKLETAKVPITSISKNGTTITPVNNNVDITVPTGALASLDSIDYDSSYITNKPTLSNYVSRVSNSYVNAGVAIKQNYSTTNVTTLSPEDYLCSPVSKYLWHDLGAFNQNFTTTYETTSDGTTWTSATLDKRFFAQKENQTIEIISATGKCGSRWTWSGVSWSQIRCLILGFTYQSSPANVTITIDGYNSSSTWDNLFTSTGSYNATPYLCWLSTSIGSHTQVRLTITKDSSDTTTISSLSSIKLLTLRWGDQGRGSELEYPYSWDADRNITCPENVTATKFIKSGGTNAQFLKADGSVDSSTYALSSDLTNVAYKNVDNSFSTSQTVSGNVSATTMTVGSHWTTTVDASGNLVFTYA